MNLCKHLIVVVLLLCSVFSRTGAVQNLVTLKDNLYSGIVVAIHPDVPENATLLEKIKELVTKASSALYVATHQRAHYGNVDILVPATWTKGNYDETISINYEQSDIRIAAPIPGNKDEPHVVQPGGCGEFGDYMHLTPNFITDQALEGAFGEKGKVFVHEWAHLRWGVFDEYPTGKNPKFYIDKDKNLQATRCPLSMEGRHYVIDFATGRASHCQLDKETKLPKSPDCQFLPGRHPGSASMMSHIRRNVAHFCHDDANDPDNKHNPFAPNDQNRLCNLRSTWAVISESRDFLGVANPPNPALADHTPTFRVLVPQAYRKFALVLDTSGSMYGDRLVEMRQAVQTFIQQALQFGNKVAVVEFASFAFSLTNGLVDVDTAEDKQNVLDTIQVVAGGGTCIGCGINEALGVLTGADGTDTCGDIIVFTDGEENQAPYVESVSQTAIDRKCTVHSIFFTAGGNLALKALSDATNGKWFFGLDKNLAALIGAFSKLANRNDGIKKGGVTQLAQETFKAEPYKKIGRNVDIDGSVGKETTFQFSWLSATTPEVELTAPDKCKHSTNPVVAANSCPGHPLGVTNVDLKTITFTIPDIAQRGKWFYDVTTTVQDSVTVTVTSKAPNEKVEPIVVDSSFVQPKKGAPVIARARITRGGSPVLNVEVTAEIQTPGGQKFKIKLLDKGSSPDTKANDGIYTKAFAQSKTPGRYSMQVTVSNSGPVAPSKQAAIIVSRAAFNFGEITEDGLVDLNPTGDTHLPGPTPAANLTDIGNFTRIDTAAGFEVEPPEDPADAARDTFAPERITDLVAVQRDTNDKTKGIVLQFTAPGDDADFGNATRYEICYTFGNGLDLITNFTNQNCIDQPLVGDVNTPFEAGTIEQFVVPLPNFTIAEGLTELIIAFAVRAFDESGNVAEPSNIGFVSFFLEPPEIPDVPTDPVPVVTRTPVAPTTVTPTTVVSVTQTTVVPVATRTPVPPTTVPPVTPTTVVPVVTRTPVPPTTVPPVTPTTVVPVVTRTSVPPTTAPTPEANDVFSCMTCYNAGSLEECDRIGKLVSCAANQKSCATEVRTQNFGRQKTVSKYCKQTLACHNNAAQNLHQCRLRQSSSVCRCCCETNRCNVGTSCP